MDFDSFYRLAHEAFQDIPEEFREGIDGLTVRSEVLPDPAHPEVFVLGQCISEAYPSDWTGPETLRSVVVLYHGSFLALAQAASDFDWEGELWETLTHELRHHLESLANEDALEGVDYAMGEAFARWRGEEFDPFYFRAGMQVASDTYQVEYDFFVEQLWTQEDFDAAEFIEFPWRGSGEKVPRPELLGDVHYIMVTGLEVGPGRLQLVLVRKRAWRERLKESKESADLELNESELPVMR